MADVIEYKEIAKSTNIRALAWKKGVGYVWFISGRRFSYKMDKALFEGMASAASVGSFFSRYVKSVCEVVWSGWACNNSPCQFDATLQGEAAGVPFRLCESCSKTPRFNQTAFSPIPPS